MNKVYNVIGLMSGTSLDGLDIANCTFELTNNGKWIYKIINAETVKYDTTWIEKLSSVEKASAFDISLLDVEYGKLLGSFTHQFIKKNNIIPDFIASHGHTIFHQPDKGLTLQIGKGDTIATVTNCTVINDFRSKDVAFGGQGAPLVPIGDRHLFGEYDFCINLGGFANISYEQDAKRIAFDICPVNIVLNYLTKQLGFPYDDEGNIASKGTFNEEMFQQLEALSFYHIKHPKSLGKEWVLNEFFPNINNFNISIEDKLCTIIHHISSQINKIINTNPSATVLLTGGGTYNSFLINNLMSNSKNNFIIPDKTIIEFKEALIFAFLGVLRFRNEDNCLSSVTGAKKDNCGGVIHLI